MRSAVFTINNYSEEDQEKLYSVECRYMILGFEFGANGTPHIQGYVEFNKVHRLGAISSMIPSAHIEQRRGTLEQARDYCKKEGEFEELGDWAAGGQGARNDIRALMTMVREDRPTLEVMEAAPELVARNLHFMDRYKAEVEKETTREFRQVDVQVYVGDAGCGKTRKAMEENPGIFTVNCSDTFPFDGYDGEKTILLDDFYGGLKYNEILRILDGHQLRVNVKGGRRYAKWTKVVITSNKRPESWYSMGLTPALARRTPNVTEFRNEEEGNNVPPLGI